MAAPLDRLSGEFWILFLYDVCEEIHLEELRAILGARPAGREPSFRRPTPEYVRFEKPPVIEYLEPLLLESGERLRHQVHYYEYGVVSIELQLSFEFGWEELIHLSSRWIAAPDIEKQAGDSVRRSLVSRPIGKRNLQDRPDRCCAIGAVTSHELREALESLHLLASD